MVQKLLNAVNNWKTRIPIYHAVQKYVNSRCSLLLIFLRFFQDWNISGCSVLLKIALWSNLSKATFVQGAERGPNVTSTRLMLHKVFEGCDHLWTRIHNCGCAASLSIRPTVCQTSEDGGDAEWYLAAARRELCNYDFISCRWWAECIYELKNASSDSSSIYLEQERLLRNVIRHELKWTHRRRWVRWCIKIQIICHSH